MTKKLSDTTEEKVGNTSVGGDDITCGFDSLSELPSRCSFNFANVCVKIIANH